MAPVHCTICGKAFANQDAYQTHCSASAKHKKKQLEIQAQAKVVNTSTTVQPAAPVSAPTEVPGASSLSQMQTTALETNPQELRAQCLKCGERLKNHDALLNHRVQLHPMVLCKPCQRYVYKDELNQHFAESPNHPSCPHCDIGFADNATLLQHLNFVHPPAPPPAPTPKLTHASVKPAPAPIASVFKTQTQTGLPCGPCNRTFKNAAAIADHFLYYQIHPKCKECNLGFLGQTEYDEHVNLKHPTPPPYTPIPSPVPSAAAETAASSSISSTAAPVTTRSSLISSTSSLPIILDEDAASETSDTSSESFEEIKAPPTCTHCNREFASEDELKKHYRDDGVSSHTTCINCQEGFLDRQALDAHWALKHPRVLCGSCRLYVYQEKLDEHFRNSPNHPKCTTCDIGFDNGIAFLQHSMAVHQELCCNICGIAFHSEELLNGHYAEHPVHPVCHECELGFRDLAALDEHVLTEHQDDASSVGTSTQIDHVSLPGDEDDITQSPKSDVPELQRGVAQEVERAAIAPRALSEPAVSISSVINAVMSTSATAAASEYSVTPLEPLPSPARSGRTLGYSSEDISPPSTPHTPGPTTPSTPAVASFSGSRMKSSRAASRYESQSSSPEQSARSAQMSRAETRSRAATPLSIDGIRSSSVISQSSERRASGGNVRTERALPNASSALNAFRRPSSSLSHRTSVVGDAVASSIQPRPASETSSSGQREVTPGRKTTPSEATLAPSSHALSWNCRICLREPQAPFATMCGHIFCHRCIIQELQVSNSLQCPVCKTFILLRLQVGTM